MSDRAPPGTLLISMHMEKCGGTSIDRVLRAQYGDGFFLYDPGPPDAHRKPEFPDNIKCIHGHMFYGLHEHFSGRHCEYITLLRDPVERFLSQFDHLRRYQHPLHEMAMKPDGLERLCADHDARHYRNLFVRRLAGAWEEVGEAELERAITVLGQFAVVGVLERASHYLAACSHRYAWTEPEFGRHNAAPADRVRLESLSDVQQQRVLDANRWDIELIKALPPSGPR